MSSKMRILRGPSALRVKMGVTQEVFAQYLGIAASTVSMVELGQRPFPKKALQRLAELEIAWAKKDEQAGVRSKEPTRALSAQQQYMRDCRQNIRRLKLSRAEYELKRMTEQYNEVMEGFAYVDLAKKIHGQEEGSQQQAALERAEYALTAALRRCNKEQQSKIEGKIAGLKIVIAAHEPVSIVEEAECEVVQAPQAAMAEVMLHTLPVRIIEEIDLVLPERHRLRLRGGEGVEVAA